MACDPYRASLAWQRCSEGLPWLVRGHERRQFQFSSCGGVGVLCVIFVVVKCKCSYLFFPFCSGLIWLTDVTVMWCLMDMVEIIFSAFINCIMFTFGFVG